MSDDGDLIKQILDLADYWSRVFYRMKIKKSHLDHVVTTSAILHATAKVVVDHLDGYKASEHQRMLKDYSDILMREYRIKFSKDDRPRIWTPETLQ